MESKKRFSRFARLPIYGILVVYAMGIFLSNFAATFSPAIHYSISENHRDWVATEPLGVRVVNPSEYRLLRGLPDSLSRAGTLVLVYSRSVPDPSVLSKIERGDVERIATGPPSDEDQFQSTTILAKTGYPFQSFRYRIDIVPGTDDQPRFLYHGAFGINGKYIPGLESWRTLTVPLVPIFPGFVVSVLFWGLVAWAFEYVFRGLWHLLKFPLGVHRRRQRRARIENNQCVKCGYPLGEFDTCPECGLAAHAIAGGES